MIIDSEVHVIFRMYPREIDHGRSLVEPWTWHELGGDLLVAEMDRAGVDRAFLISYGAENLRAILNSSEQFISGKEYHKTFFRKYPGRFYWFVTISDPRMDGSLDTLRKDFGDGATGIKIFPALMNINLDDEDILKVMDLTQRSGKRVMLGLEETTEKTPSLRSLLRQLDGLLSSYPDTNFQLNHAGCMDPTKKEAEPVFDMAKRHDNLFLSTAFLGYKTIEQGYAFDEHEYPFPTQLERLKSLYERVGPDKIMFGTDWPWVEHCRKYVQDVDAVRKHADFMSPQDKRKFLGSNALRFLGSSKDA